MKHVRHLELNNSPSDSFKKRTVEKHHLLEGHRAGTNFFRGATIALPISLSPWALVLYLDLDETSYLLSIAIGAGLIAGALSLFHFEMTTTASFFLSVVAGQFVMFAGGMIILLCGKSGS